jgi:para-aminobenzoate synthetase component 1
MNRPSAYLNSNDGSGMLAFGEKASFQWDEQQTLESLQVFIDKHKGQYIFGFLSYELKDAIFPLKSHNPNTMQLPMAYFWVPEYVVKQQKENLHFLQGEKNFEIFEYVSTFLEEETDQNFHPHSFSFKSNLDKSEYIERVNVLKNHIQRGDIYEANFCQEFVAENVDIPYTLDMYFKLNLITQAPFSVYLETEDYLICCGSPERFLQRKGDKLVSQPIKGTASRSTDPTEDKRLAEALKVDPKEKAENVMIVDLVRNDLSQVAVPGTVHVDELCEVYTYETVHQMISTISCEVQKDASFTDIIKATFPMGSMTGAPKLRAMQLIEEQEGFSRGLYSGSIGYIAPNGDFDFNVVIRTLLYNKLNKRLSCSVGSAITSLSDPEKEYKECEVKIRRILDGMNA